MENYGKLVHHIDRSDVMKQIDLMELFELEDFLERIQCIGKEQNKLVESQVRIVAIVTTGSHESFCQLCNFS